MTLSQYLHSDSNNSTDDSLMDVLQQVSSLVDSNDDEQVDLFSKIHLDPNAQDAPLKLIKLLTLLIKSRMKFPQIISTESTVTINRLVSYVQSFVSLLQALVHNSDLAALFLVGENGSQSFSELQKTTLLEQAARARSFISSIKSDSINTCLMDYQKYINDVGSLPEKMKELKSLKKQIEKTDKIENLRSQAKNVISILETALLFNDILIQNSKTNKNNQIFDKSPKTQQSNHQYKKLIKKLKKQIESLNCEISDKNSQIFSYQTQINDLQKENDKLFNKAKKSSKKDEKVTLKFESLQAQRDQLAEDVNSLKTKLLCDNQTSETINKLKEKLKKIESENRKMRDLLDEATINQNQLNNQWDTTAKDMKSDLQSKQYENNLLKEQISQLMEQINNYQRNNDQKEQKINNLSDKNSRYNSQISDLTKTQSRLQARINDLENLYKDATSQLESAEHSKADLNSQINKLRKEIKIKTNENDELKAMLDRKTSDVHKQMEENAILIKQLRRIDSEKATNDKNDDLVQKLKQKLKSAYLFIKKLQNQISEYKMKMKKDNFNCQYEMTNLSSDNIYDDFDHCCENKHTYYCEIREGAPFNYNALDSKLNDLTATIHQLEKTVHKSRAQTGLSSSSE